jgi:hypothetical protein
MLLIQQCKKTKTNVFNLFNIFRLITLIHNKIGTQQNQAGLMKLAKNLVMLIDFS